MKAILIYLPAIHRGYINFFEREGLPIYLIDLSLVREIPRLERDIRAIESETALKALRALGLEVSIITKEKIERLKEYETIIMPDEDVSHQIANDYLKGREVEYRSLFLRWERDNSTRKNLVIPDEVISKDEFDLRMMGEALKIAQKSSDWWRQVGAVLVKDSKIIATGFNRPLPSDDVHNIFGDPRSNFDYGASFEISKFIHAEASIIAWAANEGVSLKESSLYVTTFPCPVCAKLVAEAGIREVYYSEGYSLLDARELFDSYDIRVIRVSQS